MVVSSPAVNCLRKGLLFVESGHVWNRNHSLVLLRESAMVARVQIHALRFWNFDILRLTDKPFIRIFCLERDLVLGSSDSVDSICVLMHHPRPDRLSINCLLYSSSLHTRSHILSSLGSLGTIFVPYTSTLAEVAILGIGGPGFSLISRVH
jgi:hypothetical protein